MSENKELEKLRGGIAALCAQLASQAPIVSKHFAIAVSEETLAKAFFDRDHAIGQATAARDALTIVTDERDKSTAALHEKTKELADTAALLKQSETDLSRIRATLTDNTNRLSDELIHVNGILLRTTADRDRLQVALDAANESLTLLTGKLQVAEHKISDLRSSATDEATRAAKLLSVAQVNNDDYLNQCDNLRAQYANMEDYLRKELRKNEDALQQASATVTTLRAELTSLKVAVAAAEAQANEKHLAAGQALAAATERLTSTIAAAADAAQTYQNTQADWVNQRRWLHEANVRALGKVAGFRAAAKRWLKLDTSLDDCRGEIKTWAEGGDV